MEELTLEKFEEASDLVREVTNIFHPRPAIRYTLSRKTCSIPAHTRLGALIIKSVP